MHWLSHGVEDLVVACAQARCRPAVLIVGSGYGASVAALRFAEQGMEVVVLERGGEYQAGEFPNDLGQFGSHVRVQRNGGAPVGYEDALFDFRVGEGATALVGNGLGGGSLINAAVALQPDARVFQQAAWPGQLRDDGLSADFERARNVLEIQGSKEQRESPHCVPQKTQKYQRMQELGKAAAARFASGKLSVQTRDVPLAIEFRKDAGDALGPRSPCIGCGDCCSGCNHNAKLSLDKTYLARAHKAGAAIYTGVTVLRVAHRPDVAHAGRDWVATCIRTSERASWERACKNDKAAAVQAYEFEVRSAKIVLGAGTFGSSEILLRSRDRGLDVGSTWLGRGISANGDDLSAAYDMQHTAHAIGQGSGPAPKEAVGPTISAVIHFDDREDHRQSTVTEDGGIPGMLGPLAREAITTLGILPQLTRFGLRTSAGQDPLAVRPDAIARSLTLLGMGHDSAAGSAQLAQPYARLQWGWDKDASDPAPRLHRARGKSVEDLGAEFLPNPASGVLPDSLAEVLSGPTASAGWITVHPLGGCRMGSSPHQGVVNHQGQVFRADGSVHADLWVMDGSVIPTSLGVNPLLTITALAERACHLALAHAQPAPRTPRALPQRPTAQLPIEAVPGAPRGSVLAELLRGRLHSERPRQQLPAWLQAASSADGAPAALFLEMDIEDWTKLWQDARHTVQAMAGDPASRDFTASRLVIDQGEDSTLELQVLGGQVQLFAPREEGLHRRFGRTVRAGLTYWIARWGPDRHRPGAKHSFFQFAWDGLKLLWNASAARVFDYRLELTNPREPGSRYQLLGAKDIQPALSWSELWNWTWGRMTRGNWRAPQRRSVWDQLTQLDVRLLQSGQLLAAGRLTMDIPEMARRIAPQLKPGPDAINGLAAFASYPLLLLRYLVSSRMLDFRLPDYAPGLPAVDPATLPDDGQFELAHDRYPAMQLPGGARVAPEAPVCLHVPRKAGGKPEDGTLRIGLVHYAQAQPQSEMVRPGLRRHKSIILLNGFAQNTLPFVAEELGERALAAMLYAQGWDIWLLEYRVSPWLRASKEFSSMDDIGACDIPHAVDHVLAHLARAHSDPAETLGQLSVFSHCVGSASMAMSLLGGHLIHADGTPKVAGVLFSQFQPYVIGSVTAQMRLQVASLLVNAGGLEYINFSAGVAQADGLHALMDRVFASFHYDAAERCPGETDLRQMRPDCTSCKRMAGFLSRLFRHDQLLDVTHENLDQYFGRTNLGVFLHGAKCVDYEHLVNADGQNVYVTDDNVRKFLPMPIMLLHGADNVLFDQESLAETQMQFSRAFGAERLAAKHDRFLVAPGHAHFDCTIGKRAPEIIFGEVVDFFNKALTAEVPEGEEHRRLRARLPRTGPLVGWTREEGDKRVLRIWIEVDNAHADESLAAMTLVSAGRYRKVQTWAFSNNPMTGLAGAAAHAAPDSDIVYAVADIEVPRDWQGRIHIAMFSLHRFTIPDGQSPQHDLRRDWPEGWGQPMTMAEACQSDGRTPSVTGAPALAPAKPAGVKPVHAASKGPYVPDARVQPLPVDWQVADAMALLQPMAQLLKDQRRTARSANPGTLSRQRRNQRWPDECVLRLRGSQFGTAPLRFLAATCRHPGLTVLEGQRNADTLEALALRQREFQASFMCMLGDQIYADAQGGIVGSMSSMEVILPAYRNAWNTPGFARLARALPLHMVMDDHEIADNWCSDDNQLGSDNQMLFQNALSAFNAFQRAHGPKALGSEAENNIWHQGGAAFLSLNTRLHRVRALGPHQTRSILDTQQWALLENWLVQEQGEGNHPKFLVTGSVFAPGLVEARGEPSHRATDNWQLASQDRQRLLAFIADKGIHNVVFLSGDYHCSASATIRYTNSEVTSYCLITPSLHSPLRFANVQPVEIMDYEEVPLPNGQAQISAQARPGDGWLECELVRGDEGFTLHLTYRNRCFDGEALWHSESWHLR